ncbi:hypothetical protein [Demequina litorisediminis]|uniref:Uncharacterized protein n=1 Tax=Demequina litorisediminis TaxID=1849022 RepID=A0ABQ6IDX6_9MICO|nr:hypothetical protein [Demequina litorisediminis]GMA35876.1 hypothetical protein GCM10025876_20800 [Demequina litorisediminis]
MQSRPALALSLRVLLGAALVAASVVAIVQAWSEAGGAPLSTILGVVLFAAVFAAGGLAFRTSSHLIWWGLLVMLWAVMLNANSGAEYLALPLLAVAGASEPLIYGLMGIIVAVALASAVGAVGAAGAGVLAVAGLAAFALGLAYRRLGAKAATASAA